MQFIPEPYKFDTIDAVGIGNCTCLGFNNCFSVRTADNKIQNANIVNFYLETLEKLIKAGVVAWPIKVTMIGKGVAVLNDCRIPHDEYRNDFCSVCCPMDLLPITQRLQKARDIASGRVSFMQAEDMIIESCDIGLRPGPLSNNWSYHIEPVVIGVVADDLAQQSIP